MREIKFRAWDCNQNKMLFVGDNNHTKTIGIMLDSFEDEELEQYTGLKDKNGKEIYEGDIVKSQYGGMKYIVESIFDFAQFLIGWDSEYEVIGNIHENADLMGGQK